MPCNTDGPTHAPFWEQDMAAQSENHQKISEKPVAKEKPKQNKMCDTYPGESDEQNQLSKLQKARKSMSKLESLLCSTCRVLEEQKFDFDKNPELSQWWANHKKVDEDRELKELAMKTRKEMAIFIAKTKQVADLTKEDKQLLKDFGLL